MPRYNYKPARLRAKWQARADMLATLARASLAPIAPLAGFAAWLAWQGKPASPAAQAAPIFAACVVLGLVGAAWLAIAARHYTRKANG